MNNFYKDILIGLLILVGIIGFISGEFIISSAVFAVAAITSNIFRAEVLKN
jgi:hypothetical protein